MTESRPQGRLGEKLRKTILVPGMASVALLSLAPGPDTAQAQSTLEIKAKNTAGAIAQIIGRARRSRAVSFAPGTDVYWRTRADVENDTYHRTRDPVTAEVLDQDGSELLAFFSLRRTPAQGLIVKQLPSQTTVAANPFNMQYFGAEEARQTTTLRFYRGTPTVYGNIVFNTGDILRDIPVGETTITTHSPR